MSMHWKPEMEEKFMDLDFMEVLLEEKRTVKGNFEEGIYIKEVKTPFDKVSLFDGEIEIYLPSNRIQTEHCGKEFLYPDGMGVYEEYITEKGDFAFTIEKFAESSMDLEKVGLSPVADIKELYEYTSDNIQEKHENTSVTDIDQFEQSDIQISSAIAGGILEDDMDFAGNIFVIVYKSKVYRFYVIAKEELSETAYKLGKKIVEKLEIK